MEKTNTVLIDDNPGRNSQTFSSGLIHGGSPSNLSSLADFLSCLCRDLWIFKWTGMVGQSLLI